jgi:hypothetical protein
MYGCGHKLHGYKYGICHISGKFLKQLNTIQLGYNVYYIFFQKQIGKCCIQDENKVTF